MHCEGDHGEERNVTKLDKIARLAEKADAKSAKRARKRDELADSAIAALKQLGYARTSLRDIAELSGVAVGTLLVQDIAVIIIDIGDGRNRYFEVWDRKSGQKYPKNGLLSECFDFQKFYMILAIP